jgi:epoxyqueuosine reductase
MKDMSVPGKILLHTCCAPCATTCTERLTSTGYSPLLFFSNSNISDKDEYLKRLENVRKLSGLLGLELHEDFYDHDLWLNFIIGLEDEPEHGRRCLKWLAFNLGRASGTALLNGISGFTTTLSVSRYKSSPMIFEAGRVFPGFLAMDFKEGNGYARSIELSRLYGLYRQKYCGCEFSKK